jgi:hypothetical protein
MTEFTERIDSLFSYEDIMAAMSSEVKPMKLPD